MGHAFLLLFNVIYFILIPVRGLVIGIFDPWAAFFDIFLGIGLTAIIWLFYRVSHTRLGALLVFIDFAYWWLYPCNWVIREWPDFQFGYQGTFFIMWGCWFYFAFITLLALVRSLLLTIDLRVSGHSFIWGPWVARKEPIFRKRFTPEQKRILTKGAAVVLCACGIVGASLLAYYFPPAIPIRITPQNYPITYNFWATPDINGTYPLEWQTTYGFGDKFYNDSILAEFNEHRVNLDLTFNAITNDSVQMLKWWEERCPNITYRVTIYPSNGLAELFGLVKNATEILRTCERNGTLNQWRGFCFDIEGDPYRFRSNYTTFAEGTAVWDQVFDYIDEQSNERGTPIDMECVSDPWVAIDVPFDGDTDIQAQRGLNEYYPERFTSYAPMIYRCWYKGTKPFGSPQDPEDPWDTSYAVYSTLYTLNHSVPAGKAGFYIGITNTSCYDRDLPQPEPYSWPTGPNSGLANLLRDTLIAKHFGIREITFFLAWTAIENGYFMGGVFESYGIDFLDVVNETVNVHPPASFDIYFNHGDAQTSEDYQKDWVYDFSRPLGWIEVAGLWAFAGVIGYYSQKKRKQQKTERPN